MRHPLLKVTAVMSLLLLMAFAAPGPRKKTKLYMIGDSTMANKPQQVFPETGWGMPLATFFDTAAVVVDNRAQNGRSTRTFLAENRWQPIVDALQEGDYVFIQFGHNDEAENYPDRYTPPEDYRKNLIKFVTETQRKKANPVLLTPITRRKFDKDGRQQETHVAYSKVTTEVANKYKVPLIDLDKMSRDLVQQFGVDKSLLLYLELAPGDHPNYPYGHHDNTHFTELGARKMAQLAVSQVVAQKLPILSEHLAKPTAKNAVPPATNGKDAQPTTP
ncbi:rhamnogalacturonan acetylesterase [Hymenobacter sp. GOD-10R]|uniref:rhamnogalacturonan acetylesterase n=1 Tax=Hymenobacter sp. GOD-10R TaxID=3093922 RepID=UPI002D76847B|nr:rhamnogalacturonan acetylesterase [Hymenobacter sp. GOD-10R]WRQ26156.1 rhamnogalacturonan acetylesterase [Hymenobacter sp. GOD-10R]